MTKSAAFRFSLNSAQPTRSVAALVKVMIERKGHMALRSAIMHARKRTALSNVAVDYMVRGLAFHYLIPMAAPVSPSIDRNQEAENPFATLLLGTSPGWSM